MTEPAGLNHPDNRRHVVLGAGPVGRAIVTHLVDRGIAPTVVTRSGTSVPGAIARRADITDADQLAGAVAGRGRRVPVRPAGVSPLAGGVPRAPSGRDRRRRRVGFTAGRGGEPLRLWARRRGPDRGPAAAGRHQEGRRSRPHVPRSGRGPPGGPDPHGRRPGIGLLRTARRRVGVRRALRLPGDRRQEGRHPRRS